MTTTHLDPADKSTAVQSAIQLMRTAYPGYRGRKFKVSTIEGSVNLQSSWQGGSRNYYILIDLATSQTSPVMPAQSQFDTPVKGLDAVTLPPNAGVVEHSIFCGKDMGLTLVIGPNNATQFLPTVETLPEDHQTVLNYTRSLKNTYGGQTNIRYTEAHRETGITQERWTAAQQSLMASQHLRKNGSITAKGKNAAPHRW